MFTFDLLDFHSAAELPARSRSAVIFWYGHPVTLFERVRKVPTSGRPGLFGTEDQDRFFGCGCELKPGFDLLAWLGPEVARCVSVYTGSRSVLRFGS